MFNRNAMGSLGGDEYVRTASIRQQGVRRDLRGMSAGGGGDGEAGVL